MSFKNRVVLANNQIENHTPLYKQVPPELEGLTAQIIAEVLDAGRCYGTHYPQENLKRLRLKGDITISVSAMPNNRTFHVIGPGGEMTDGAHVVGLNGGGYHIAFWDKRVELQAVLNGIEHSDAVAYERGIIDDDGPRRVQPLNLPTDKLPKPVPDRVCAKRAYKIVKFSAEDAKQERELFCDPDKMVIIPAMFNMWFVCHQKDEALIQRQVEIIKEVAVENGIPEDTINRKLFEPLVEEIDRRIAAEVVS